MEMTTELASSLFMNNTHAAVPDRPAENIAEGYMPDGSQAGERDIHVQAAGNQVAFGGDFVLWGIKKNWEN